MAREKSYLYFTIDCWTGVMRGWQVIGFATRIGILKYSSLCPRLMEDDIIAVHTLSSEIHPSLPLLAQGPPLNDASSGFCCLLEVGREIGNLSPCSVTI